MTTARFRRAAASALVSFFDEGAVNYPRPSDGLWFLTQYPPMGLLNGDHDDAAIAATISQTALYREAAALTESACPKRFARMCCSTGAFGTDKIRPPISTGSTCAPEPLAKSCWPRHQSSTVFSGPTSTNN